MTTASMIGKMPAIRRRSAATAISYGFIAAGIALAVALALPGVSKPLNATFCRAAAALGGSPACGGSGTTSSGSTASTGTSTGSAGTTAAPTVQTTPPPATGPVSCGGFAFPFPPTSMGAIGQWFCYDPSGAQYAGVDEIATPLGSNGAVAVIVDARYPDNSQLFLETAVSSSSGYLWPGSSTGPGVKCTISSPAPLATTLSSLDSTQKSVFTDVPDYAAQFPSGAVTRTVFCPAG